MLIYIKLLLLLPGTFLHELAHYIPALLFRTKPTFSVLPKLNEGTAGRVTHQQARYKISNTIIAMMPLIWWVLLFVIYNQIQLLSYSLLYEEITLRFTALHHYTYVELITLIYLTWQLLWAGSLSRQDWLNAINGMVSISGVILIASIVLLYYVKAYL